MTPRRRLAALGATLLIGVACSVAAPGSSDDPSASPVASTDELPSGTAAETLPASASPSPSALETALPDGPDRPIAAAAWLLDQPSAVFRLHVDRFKPNLPDSVDVEASGITEPARDRGRMRWELWPADSASPPLEPLRFEIAWDATDWWAAAPAEGNKPQEWTHSTRAEVPDRAIIGRVQEEPLGLLRFVAEADPASIEALPAGTLGGVAAERWLVRVPVAKARAAFIPPDTYLAFDTIFDVDALPVEVWLVDGRIARVGYVFEREKAPYGGADRIETWCDWTDVGEPIDLVIPPPGEIVELPA